MPFQFFRVPVADIEDAQRDLNAFLSSKRILAVEREFVSCGDASFWAICVDFLDPSQKASSSSGKRNRIDYREVLSEEEFASLGVGNASF